MFWNYSLEKESVQSPKLTHNPMINVGQEHRVISSDFYWSGNNGQVSE